MKTSWVGLTGLAAMLSLSGCAMYAERPGMPPLTRKETSADPASARPDRMLIWTAYLTVEVGNLSTSVREVLALAEREGGFVERKSDDGESSAHLVLRVPASALKTVLSALETLGTVTRREVSAADVTEQFIDLEARLKNKIVLRERLQQLLEKATEVKDILAIETELNRLQADIDSMEGQIQSLKGRVEYTMISLNLYRKTILGPIGYVIKGLWWGIEKLFVIRK